MIGFIIELLDFVLYQVISGDGEIRYHVHLFFFPLHLRSPPPPGKTPRPRRFLRHIRYKHKPSELPVTLSPLKRRIWRTERASRGFAGAMSWITPLRRKMRGTTWDERLPQLSRKWEKLVILNSPNLLDLWRIDGAICTN